MTTTAVMAQTPLIRLAHPLAFAALLQKVGTPTDPLFRRLGLPVGVSLQAAPFASRAVEFQGGPLLLAGLLYDSRLR
jgi:hypothetical protein